MEDQFEIFLFSLLFCAYCMRVISYQILIFFFWRIIDELIIFFVVELTYGVRKIVFCFCEPAVSSLFYFFSSLLNKVIIFFYV